MKKKFLSLMMAAAVVATTSVSAFADSTIGGVTYPDSPNVITQDDTETTSDVTITGNVTDDKGNMPTASFKVTVPTAASFTVNKSGFIGADLEVKNEGTQEIEVYAKSFSRVSGGTGKINTVTEEQIAGDNTGSPNFTKAHVSLKLEGQRFEGKTEDSVAYLNAVNGKRGVYTQSSLQDSALAEGDGVKLLALRAGDTTPQTAKIKLKGTAGTGEVTTAITDKFQLTLKIKKVTKLTKE